MNKSGSVPIRQNTELLEVTVEQAQEEIFWIGSSGKILYANQSACKSLGYSADDIREIGFFNIDENISTTNWKQFLEVLRMNEKLRYESVHLTKNKQRLYVEVSMNYYQISDKEFITAFCHNIEKRREVERALKDSEEKFRLMTEKSTDTLLHIDKSGIIQYASPAAESFFDCSLESLLSTSFFDFCDHKELPHIKSLFTEVLNNEKTQTIEVQIILGDQHRKIAELDIVPFHERGRVVANQFIIRDITLRKKAEQALENALLRNEQALTETHLLNQNLENEIAERKKAERELIQARAEAEAANRAKSEFLANMSHEIRTPLNAVLGFAEILNERLQGSEYVDFIEGIDTGARSLLSLISDILDLSKIEAGRMELQKEPVAPLTLLTEVRQIFMTKIQSKGLELIIQKPENTPAFLEIDHTRVRQILFNLVGNAIKFTSTGSISLIIDFRGKLEKGKRVDFIIEVKDTGMGIPRKQQKLIFEPFTQQEGQSNRRFGGTGLGLAITRRLVEMMNGSIELESRLAHGSSFKVTLRNVLIPATGTDIDKPVDTDYRALRFKDSRILIVEDNAFNRIVFREFLAKTRLKIYEAENGKAALEKIDEVKPHIVFVDLRLPDIDGYSVCHQIRQNAAYRTTPIIAFSATMVMTRPGNELSIFTDSLLKPLARKSLYQLLSKYLPYSIDKTEEQKHRRENEEDVQDIVSQLRNVKLNRLTKPEEFRNKYKTHISGSTKELKEFIDIDTASLLASRLLELSSEFELEFLKHVAEELTEACSSFKMGTITGIVNALSLFEERIYLTEKKTNSNG